MTKRKKQHANKKSQTEPTLENISVAQLVLPEAEHKDTLYTVLHIVFTEIQSIASGTYNNLKVPFDILSYYLEKLKNSHDISVLNKNMKNERDKHERAMTELRKNNEMERENVAKEIDIIRRTKAIEENYIRENYSKLEDQLNVEHQTNLKMSTELRDEIARLSSEKSTLHTDISELEKTRQHHIDEPQCKAALSVLRAITARENNDRIDILNATIDNLRRQGHSDNEAISTYQQAQQVSRENIRQLNGTITYLRQQLSEKEQEIQQLNQLKSRLFDYERKIANKESEIGTLRNSIIDWESLARDAIDQKREIELKHDTIREKYNKLLDKYKQLTNDHWQLKEEHQKNEQHHAAISYALNGKVDNYEREISDLRSELYRAQNRTPVNVTNYHVQQNFQTNIRTNQEIYSSTSNRQTLFPRPRIEQLPDESARLMLEN